MKTRSYCNEKVNMRAWLKNATICKLNLAAKFFSKHVTHGKIVYRIFELLQPQEEYIDWLNRVLLTDITKTKTNALDTFILLNRISLQTNTIIRIFEVEHSDHTPTCESEHHLNACCTITPKFISGLTNLTPERKRKITFVIDRTNSFAVYQVEEKDFYREHNIYESDYDDILTEAEFTRYLQDKYNLDHPPTLNFREEVNQEINVHLYVAYGFVKKTKLWSKNQIEYIGSWGRAENPDLKVIILSAHLKNHYLVLGAENDSVKTTVNRYMSHVKASELIEKKYPRKKFSDDECPCESIPFMAKSQAKKHSPPVGNKEQDFTQALKMFGMFGPREQKLILACSHLSIASYDIER